MATINLARQPFANRRPLDRTGRALLVVGAVLLVLNGVLFWRYLSSSADLRGQLREVRGQIEEENRALREIARELRTFDLDAQNQRVLFLNEKIAQRSFGWSQLFEELGEVLPRDVKLYNLSPSVERRRSRQGQVSNGDSEQVVLVMSGVATDTEPLLALIDALFEHPAFAEPRLSGESREEGGQIRFDLTATYRPDRPVTTLTTDDETTESPPGIEETETEPGSLAGVPSSAPSTTQETAAPEASLAGQLVREAPVPQVEPASEAATPSDPVRRFAPAQGDPEAETGDRVVPVGEPESRFPTAPARPPAAGSVAQPLAGEAREVGSPLAQEAESSRTSSRPTVTRANPDPPAVTRPVATPPGGGPTPLTPTVPPRPNASSPPGGGGGR